MSEENNQVVEQEVVDPKEGKKKKQKPKWLKILEWVLLSIFLLIFGFVTAGQIDGMINRDKHYGESIRFGVGTFYVLTNSMEPKYHQGDAIITYLEDFNQVYSSFNKGQTVDITFKNIDTGIRLPDDEFIHPEYRADQGGQLIVTNYVMTHRIMEIHIDESKKVGQGHYIIVTAGINHGGKHSAQGQYQILTEKQYLGTVKINSSFLGGVFDFISTPWGLLVLLLIPAFYLIVTSAIDIFKALKEGEENENVTVSGDGNASLGTLNSLSEEDKERLKRELLDQMIEERNKKKDE